MLLYDKHEWPKEAVELARMIIPWLRGRFTRPPLSVADVHVHTIKDPPGDDKWLQHLPNSLKFHRKGVSEAQDQQRAEVFKKRRNIADELEERREMDSLFSFIDNHDREVHVTQEMARLYIGQGTNMHMWNTSCSQRSLESRSIWRLWRLVTM